MLKKKKKTNMTAIKAGFHMIATIAMIAGKKRSAIDVIIWKPLFSDRCEML